MRRASRWNTEHRGRATEVFVCIPTRQFVDRAPLKVIFGNYTFPLFLFFIPCLGVTIPPTSLTQVSKWQ